MRGITRAFLAFSIVAVLAGVDIEAQEQAFKVIVNAGVSTSSLTVKELSRVFMKKDTTWPSGLKMTPVNLGADHPTREAFSQAVHGKGAQPIERRWETLIFSGMGVPPPKLEIESEVVEFVKSNAGAIGYVAAETPLPPEVKELEITP